LRRSTFAAAVVSLVAAFAAPAAHARPASDIAAVAVHPWQLGTHDARERVFGGVEATGVRWVRVDMPWAWVEEHGPSVRSGHGHWSALDNIVQAADRHHLKLVGILGFTPEWASDSGELWSYPYSEPFEEFFAAALRRYPQIQAWELWNEPNFARFSKPGPNPTAFVEFLRAARHARDSVGSHAKLISGGIAPGGEIDVNTWINEVALRGGLSLIDGFGIHPYSAAEPDDPRSWMMQLEGLHNRLAQLGRPDLPLWLTEFGAPSVAVASGYAPALTEAEQADRLRTAFALASRFDWIENLTWYEYRDSCTGSSDPECNFGLVRSDLTPKPAYGALRDVVAGATAQLRPRLTLSTRVSRARLRVTRSRVARPRAAASPRGSKKRRRVKRSVVQVVNRITISGRLVLPGTAWPSAPITIRLPRRNGATRTARVMVKEGIFWARFEGRDLASGMVEVRYPGDAAYQPLTTQVQVAITPAKRR
jgi:polysaccharide biosynthesis protein PslG